MPARRVVRGGVPARAVVAAADVAAVQAQPKVRSLRPVAQAVDAGTAAWRVRLDRWMLGQQVLAQGHGGPPWWAFAEHGDAGRPLQGWTGRRSIRPAHRWAPTYDPPEHRGSLWTCRS